MLLHNILLDYFRFMFHLLFWHVAVKVSSCCHPKISIFAANVLIYLGFVLFQIIFTVFSLLRWIK